MPNVRRENFVYEYLRDLNATQAATRSGYRHPHVQGSRLLKHPEVIRQLDVERAQLKEDSRLSAKQVIALLECEATNSSNSGAVRVRALELLGKHLGLFLPSKKGSESVRFLFADE